MNIIYLGFTGSLYGTATGEKIRLICKSLIIAGANVSILSRKRKAALTPDKGIIINENNDNINLINVAEDLYTPKNSVKRNIFKLVLFIKEIKILKAYTQNTSIDIGIISSRNFLTVLFYRLISKYFKFSLVLNYMELNSAMVLRSSYLNKVNDLFYEKFAFKLLDAILPISHYLDNFVKTIKPEIPTFVTPVLVNIELFESILPRKSDTDYFLFCGAAAFEEIIAFTIKSFELVNNNSVKLQFICHGTEKEMNSIKEIIAKSERFSHINLNTNLDYEDLIRHYKGALALLIPLRPILQDKARFPHKIGEYTAAGRPIISNKYGEVDYYFTDGENALLADSYDPKLFAEKMNYVINNLVEADQIGERGRELGREKFDYKNYGKQLLHFFNGL